MKTLKEIKQFDTITLSEKFEDITKIMFEDFHNGITPNIYFPLEEGVIKVTSERKEETQVLYFYFTRIQKNIFRIECSIYLRKDFQYHNTVDFTMDLDNDTSFNVLWKNEKLNQSDILESYSKSLYCVLGYIIKVKDNPVTKIKKAKKTKTAKDNPISEHRKDVKTKRTVTLGERVIYEINTTDEGIKHFRKYTRRTESWSVIGHYRHYKNGKTVYIEPCIKGQGKRVKKEYKI